MQLRPKSYVYDPDYFHKYNQEVKDLLYDIVYHQQTQDIPEEELDNLFVDGLYSVLDNYTSFMSTLYQANTTGMHNTTTFDCGLTLHKEHMYVLRPDEIMQHMTRHYDLNPLLNDYFYDTIVGDKSESEVDGIVDNCSVLCRIMEDILIKKVIANYNAYALSQENIYVYINLVGVNKTKKALHIVLFEEVEEV